MNKHDSEKIQTIIRGIFKIPKKRTATPLLFPEMDEESYTLVENLRQRVLHAGKTMQIAEHQGSANALLVGQSEQIAIFIQEFDINEPRFIWLRLDKIKQLFYPNWIVAEYIKHGRLPGQPPFISGLDWEIEKKSEKYWLTCANPPLNGEIAYSNLAIRFQRLYPEIGNNPPPPKSKKIKETDGKTTHDLRPLFSGGIKP